MLMRIDQSRHQGSACEIHTLRIGADLRQHLIPGADCNDLAAGDRDGVRGRIAVVHRDHGAAEEHGSRLVSRWRLGLKPRACNARDGIRAGR